MLLGFGFARRKMFVPAHKFVMTGVTLANWVLIGAVMIGSYSTNVAPGIPTYLSDIRNLLPTIHLLTGGIAQVLATYLVILMWTERTALEKLVPFRIKKIKTPMRLTLALWLTSIVLGIGIYFVWNPGGIAGDTSTPVSTEEAPESTEAAPESTEAAAETAPASTEAPDPAATEESASSGADPYGAAAPASTEAPDPASTEEAGG
jgi:uncharacterized membrane protein YozB (DUF420 family)